MPRPTYKINQSHTLRQRRHEEVMPITHSEWCRVKDLAFKIKAPKNTYGYLASIMIGVFPSAIFAMISFDADTKNWYKITVICLLVISLVLSLVFYVIHQNHEESNSVLGQDILTEMHRIEEQFNSSVSDGEEIPID